MEDIEEAHHQATNQALKNDEIIRKLIEELEQKEQQLKGQKNQIHDLGTSNSFFIPWNLSLTIEMCKKENVELSKQLEEMKYHKDKATQRLE